MIAVWMFIRDEKTDKYVHEMNKELEQKPPQDGGS
jgi:hypothetical protein